MAAESSPGTLRGSLGPGSHSTQAPSSEGNVAVVRYVRRSAGNAGGPENDAGKDGTEVEYKSGCVETWREWLAHQLNTIPRNYRRMILIVLPVGCLLLANLIYYAVRSTVAFQAASNSVMKARATSAFDRLSVLLMDERDNMALAMSTLGAAPAPLSSSLGAVYSATDSSIVAARDAIAAIAAPGTDFNADRNELNARIGYLAALASDLATYRTYVSLYIVAGPATSAIRPWTHVFRFYTDVVRLTRDWQLSVVRLGLDRQRTQSTAPFASTVFLRSQALDLRSAYNDLRGLMCLAVGLGRWETSGMYDTFVSQLNDVKPLTDRLRFFGGGDVGAIVDTLSSTDARLVRFNLLTSALVDTAWFVRPLPAFAPSGLDNSTFNASSTARYIDDNTLLYATMYPGMTVSAVAWSIFNESSLVAAAFSSRLQAYMEARSQSDTDNVRREAVNDLVYTICVSLAAVVICIVLYCLSEKSSSLEVAAQEERNFARASEAFTNMIAHEMRNPLHGIVANVEQLKMLLDSSPLPEDEIREIVNDIDLSSGQMMRLATDVLDMARLRRGKMNIVWGPTDLWAIIRDTMHAFRTLAAESDVNIEYDIDRELPPVVWLDGTRVRQLISNGVTNACKAIKSKKAKHQTPRRIIIRVRYLELATDLYDRKLVDEWQKGVLDPMIAAQREALHAPHAPPPPPLEQPITPKSSGKLAGILSGGPVSQSLSMLAKRMFGLGQDAAGARPAPQSSKVMPLLEPHVSSGPGRRSINSLQPQHSVGAQPSARNAAVSSRALAAASALALASDEEAKDYVITRRGMKREMSSRHMGSGDRGASRLRTSASRAASGELPGAIPTMDGTPAQPLLAPTHRGVYAVDTSNACLANDVTAAEEGRHETPPMQGQSYSTPRAPLELAVNLNDGRAGSEGSSERMKRPSNRPSISEAMKSFFTGSGARVQVAKLAPPPASQSTGHVDAAARSVSQPAVAPMPDPPSTQVPLVMKPTSPTSAAGRPFRRAFSKVSPDEFIAAVYFEVVDTGVGLGNDDPEEKFIEYSSKFGEKSTGLGLPICRKLAQRMHGDVWLDRVPKTDPIFDDVRAPPAEVQSPGHGSTITTPGTGPIIVSVSPSAKSALVTQLGISATLRERLNVETTPHDAARATPDAAIRGAATHAVVAGTPSSSAVYHDGLSPGHQSDAGVVHDLAPPTGDAPTASPATAVSPTVVLSVGSPPQKWRTKTTRASSVEMGRTATRADSGEAPAAGLRTSSIRNMRDADMSPAVAAALHATFSMPAQRKPRRRAGGKSRSSADPDPSAVERTRFAPSLTVDATASAGTARSALYSFERNALPPFSGAPVPVHPLTVDTSPADVLAVTSADTGPNSVSGARPQALSTSSQQAGTAKGSAGSGVSSTKALDEPSGSRRLPPSVHGRLLADQSPVASSSEGRSTTYGVVHVQQPSGPASETFTTEHLRKSSAGAPASQPPGSHNATSAATLAPKARSHRHRTGAKLCFIIPVIAPPDDDIEEDISSRGMSAGAPSPRGGSLVYSQMPNGLSATSHVQLPVGYSSHAHSNGHARSHGVLVGSAARGLHSSQGASRTDAIPTEMMLVGAAAMPYATAPEAVTIAHAVNITPTAAPRPIPAHLPSAQTPTASMAPSNAPAAPPPPSHPPPVLPQRPPLSETGGGRRDSTASTAAAADALPLVDGRQIRVIFCDDEVVNMRIGERMLKRLGVSAILAEDGDQLLPALQHAAQDGYPIQLIFLDITMKRMPGDVACKQLRALGYTLPIVAVTGECDAATLLAHGFNDFVFKPFSKDALQSAIVRWVLSA